MDDDDVDFAIARLRGTDQFEAWANDRAKSYPSDGTFSLWREVGLVRPAEEGFALTKLGRAVAAYLQKAKGSSDV